MTRQQRILQAIATHWTDHGYAPSLRAIELATGVGLSTVKREVDDARRAGLVAFSDRQPRTVRLTDQGRAAIAEERV